MRLEVSPELSAFVAARIANYAAEATAGFHRREASDVTKHAALPLIRHWEETIGLRADGEFVRWSDEADNSHHYTGVLPVNRRYDWLSALVEGTRRWPELQTLLPAKPVGATNCWCVGHRSYGEGGFLCPFCCSLRWVEAGVPLTDWSLEPSAPT